MQVNHEITQLRIGGYITIPEGFRDSFGENGIVEFSIKEGKQILLQEFKYVKNYSEGVQLIGSRKIDRNGAVLIPKKARDILNIIDNDWLKMNKEDQHIIIKKTIINTNQKTLIKLKSELLRIGSTNRSNYDLLKKKGNLSSSQICRNIGMNWREIVKELGLKPTRVLLPQEKMLIALKGEFERLGSFKRTVYEERRNKEYFPHYRVLTDYLGMSWADITKACGLKNQKIIIADTVSDEDLINEYKKISKLFGRPATVKEINDNSAYTYEIYRLHFGTMGELRRACGFELRTKRSTSIVSKKECIRELRSIYDKYGRLSFSQLKETSTISITTYFRKFHTTKINEIWDEVLKSENIKSAEE